VGLLFCFLIFALLVVMQCLVPIVAYISAYYPFLTSLKFIYLPQPWLTIENTPYLNRGKLTPVVL
jgi:hypothetical protein